MSWALTKGNLHLRWRQGGFTPHAYLGIKLLTVTEKAHENVIIIQVFSLKNKCEGLFLCLHISQYITLIKVLNKLYHIYSGVLH